MFIAERFRSLVSNDFRILSVTELLMKSHEFVPLQEIVRFSRLREDEVVYRIRRLSRDRFLAGSPRAPPSYQGYVLTVAGYDALALKALVASGAVEAVGKSLGVGKESDIYEALDGLGKRCVIKFHRLGRTSFRQTSRKRGYVAGRSHISWLYQSRLSAEREYAALRALFAAGVSVPKPLAYSRHAIVMSVIEGTELKFAELKDPAPILREILRNIRMAYCKVGLVHSDLSEYNILVKANGQLLVIDWPQSVDVSHPNAGDNLRKDISNVIKGFTKKAGLRPDEERVLEYVTGKRRALTL